MRYLRLLVTGGTLLFLAGCFQTTTVVRVNPDGSGTVEEKMLLGKKMVARINEMMRGLAGDTGEKPKPLEIFEPDKLREKARTMGAGVTYRSGEKVETAEYTGYTATYAFTDINRLQLSRESGAPTGESKADSLPLTFHFRKGSPATLTIVQTRSPAAGKTAAAPAEEPGPAPAVEPRMSDADAEQFAEMITGMKFVVAVEVNGTIVSTNATHRSGNRLTILDLDLEKLGAAAPELEKLSRLQSGSMEDARELAGKIPGLLVDLNDTVTVVFTK